MLLADLEADTVDFGPNFDASVVSLLGTAPRLQPRVQPRAHAPCAAAPRRLRSSPSSRVPAPPQMEPLVLPARVPNLLINGSSGIAVGIATKIPPHNMREVVAGLRALIRNPNITIQELMRYIPAPDFPTGGCPGQLACRRGVAYARPGVPTPARPAVAGGQLILNEAVQQAYTEGKGGVLMRAKMHIENDSDANDSAAGEQGCPGVGSRCDRAARWRATCLLPPTPCCLDALPRSRQEAAEAQQRQRAACRGGDRTAVPDQQGITGGAGGPPGGRWHADGRV